MGAMALPAQALPAAESADAPNAIFYWRRRQKACGLGLCVGRAIFSPIAATAFIIEQSKLALGSNLRFGRWALGLQSHRQRRTVTIGTHKIGQRACWRRPGMGQAPVGRLARENQDI